jgi:hypothetical protein
MMRRGGEIKMMRRKGRGRVEIRREGRDRECREEVGLGRVKGE